MEDNVIISSTQQTVGMNAANISLLKLGTFGQTILGVVVTGFVLAATVATIALISTRVGFDPPEANPDHVSMYKNTAINIYPLSNDVDPRGGTLIVSSIGTPLHGTAQISSDQTSITYTANRYYAGVDQFEYVVNNEKQSSKSYIVINITNNAPEAIDFEFEVSRNSKANAYALFNLTTTSSGSVIEDVDDDRLMIVNVTTTTTTEALNGLVWFDDQVLYYTPNEGFKKNETIVYTISDYNDTSSASITFIVQNDAPEPQPDSFVLQKNQVHVLDILANDIDKNNDTLTIVSFGSCRGVLTLIENSTYLSYESQSSTAPYTDSFEYTVVDSEGATASSYATIRLINSAPVAKNGTFTVVKNSENNRADIVYSDSDMLDVQTVTIEAGPLYGTVKLVEQTTDQNILYADNWFQVPKYSYYLQYTPNKNSDWDDYVKYKVTDTYDNAYGYITFTIQNAAPIANTDYIRCSKNNEIQFNVVANDTDPNGDDIELVFSTDKITSTVNNSGTITKVSSKVIQYVPKSQFTGIDSFVYTIRDIANTASKSLTAQGTVYVEVYNEAPVANSDQTTVNRFKTVTIHVLDNDSDPNGDTIVIESVVDTSSISSGISISSDKKTLNFTASGTIGKSVFTYTIADNEGLTASSTVSVNVINTVPVAVDDKYQVAWNKSISFNVLSNDIDEDGDSLKVLSHTSPSSGTLNLVANLFVYQPNKAFVGNDSFTYYVSDGIDSSVKSATVTISVYNHVPVANADTASTHWTDEKVIDVLANDVDEDGDTLYIKSVTNGSYGTVSIVTISGSSGSSGLLGVQYTPNKNFVGKDTFQYTVSDWNRESVGTVTITLTNTVPVPVADEVNMHWSDSSITINVLDNDIDADLDTITIKNITGTSPSSQGTVTIVDASEGTIKYTSPSVSTLGTVSFTYFIQDIQPSLKSATVKVNIINLNKPSATSSNRTIHWRTLDTAGYTEFKVYSSAKDLDGDIMSLSIAQQPTYGTLIVYKGSSLNTFRFSNTDTWKKGNTHFEYTLSDGISSSSAVIYLTVYNNAPVAGNVDMELHASKISTGTTIDVLSLTTDQDSEDQKYLTIKSISLTSVRSGANVTIVSSSSSSSSSSSVSQLIYYKPEQGQTGTDMFTYVVSDGLEESTGTVSITVNYVEVQATDKYYTYHWADIGSTGVILDVLADVDSTGTTKTLSLVSVSSEPSQGGSAAIVQDTDGSDAILYKQKTGFKGTEQFNVTYSDGTSDATIHVTVEITNDAPVATNQEFSEHWTNSFYEFEVLSGGGGVTDPNGDSVTLSAVSMVKGSGSVKINSSNGKVIYTPPSLSTGLAYVGSGQEQFKYTVTDTIQQSSAVVDVIITNDAPVANAKSFSVHWSDYKNGKTLDVMNEGGIVDSDSDSDTITLKSVGTVTPSDSGTTVSIAVSNNKNLANITGTPPQSLVRSSFKFDYTITDGATTSTQVVTVSITNDKPTTSDFSKKVHWSSSNIDLAVIATPLQSDGDTLTVASSVVSNVAGSTSGRVYGSGSVIKYTPTSGFEGTETLTYTVTDGIETATGKAVITVYNNAPTSVSLTNSTHWRTANMFSFDILGNSGVKDADSEDTVTLVDKMSGLNTGDSYSINSGGILSITLGSTSKSPGTLNFKYYVTDGRAVVEGSITITLTNSVPVASSKTVTFSRMYGTSKYTITGSDILLANDAIDTNDQDPLTLVVQSGGQKASDSNNVVVVVIDEYFKGNKYVDFAYSDTQATSATARATVVFTNAAPTCTATSVTLNKGASKTFTVSCSDANGDPVTVVAATSDNTSVPGTLTLSSSKFTYVAPTNTSGSWTAYFTGTDGVGEYSSKTAIQITVNNRAPTASAYTWTVVARRDSNTHTLDYKTAAGVTDADGDTLSYAITSQTCEGTMSFSGSTLNYVRPFTYSTASCIVYVTITDNDASNPLSTTSTVTVNISTESPVAEGVILEVEDVDGGYFTLTESEIIVNDYDTLGGTKKFGGWVTPCQSGSGFCRYDPVKVGTNSWRFSQTSSECQTDRFRYILTTEEDSSQSTIGILDIRFLKCTCTKPLDVVFVIDGSGSVGSTNFADMKSFILSITQSFDIGSGSKQIQVGIVLFSSSVNVVLQLSSSRTTVEKAINGMSWPQGGTNILYAIKKAQSMLESGRDKSSVGKLIITVFDGEPSVPCSCSDCVTYAGSQENCNNDRWPYRDCKSCFQGSPLRCSPCADPIPLLHTLNNYKPDSETGVWPAQGYWRNMVIGLGSALSNQYAKQLLLDMSYDSSLVFSIDWSQMEDITDRINSQSCDLVDTSRTTTPSVESVFPGYHFCGQIVAIASVPGTYWSITDESTRIDGGTSATPNYPNTRNNLFQVTNCGDYGTVMQYDSVFSLWSLQNQKFVQRDSSTNDFKPNGSSASNANAKFRIKPEGNSGSLRNWDGFCLGSEYSTTSKNTYVWQWDFVNNQYTNRRPYIGSYYCTTYGKVYFHGVTYNEIAYRVDLPDGSAFPTPIPTASYDRTSA